MNISGNRASGFETIFSEPLDDDARSWLGDELVSRRAAILWNAVRSPHDDLASARRAAVETYFVALQGLVIGAREAGLAHVGHWAPSFYLLYLISPHTSEEVAAQAATNLFAMLLCEDGGGASPLDGLTIRTRCNAAGELHVFSRDAAVRIAGLSHPYAELQWECGRHTASVRAADSRAGSLEVRLPLAHSGPVGWRQFERAPGFNVPICDDPWVAILRGGATPYCSTRSREDDNPGSRLLPLAESLSAAHALLAQLLPEVVPWLALFAPAIAEVPPPAAPGARSSGSRLPGTPIHLSRVHDAFGHAEDLVHELQHARYQFLSALDQYFGAFCGARHEVFVSPYRTDARPLAGIHLGLHAFLAVTRLRLRAYAAGRRDGAFVRDLLRVHRMNVFSYRTIVTHERFSPEGLRLFGQIAEALWEQHQAVEAVVPPDVVTSVEAELARHRALVVNGTGSFLNADVDFSPMTERERAVHAVAAADSPAGTIEVRA